MDDPLSDEVKILEVEEGFICLIIIFRGLKTEAMEKTRLTLDICDIARDPNYRTQIKTRHFAKLIDQLRIK